MPNPDFGISLNGYLEEEKTNARDKRNSVTEECTNITTTFQ